MDEKHFQESDENADIRNMLFRYYAGMATSEETSRLEAWINLSDEHRDRARDWYAAFLATASYCVEKEMDVDEEWHRFCRRLTWRLGLWHVLKWTQRVAAVLFVPLLAVTWWALSRPVSAAQADVPMYELRVKPCMTAECRLPDSTLVHLNSGSVLRYPSVFGDSERVVELSGEAYFEVAHDSLRKFRVNLGKGVQVEVLGTHFNIDAYQNQDDIVTTLTEGTVELVYPAAAGEHRQRMRAGEKAVYDKTERTLQLKPTDGEVELSWKDRKVTLKKTPFPEALHMLAKHYGVEFSVRTDRYADYTFTGTFTNQTLEEVLDIFRVSSKVRWRTVVDSLRTQEQKQIEIY